MGWGSGTSFLIPKALYSEPSLEEGKEVYKGLLSDLETGSGLSMKQSLRLLALGPFPLSKLLALSLQQMT